MVLVVVEIDGKLLEKFDEGNCNGALLCCWFTNVVGMIDCGGKDIA